MYQQLPSFVLGFHGCDRKIGEAVLAGDQISPSMNEYDWLGEGAYFWESSPERALSYARLIKQYKRGQGSIKEPYVVGAVIDLGLCLNHTEEGALYPGTSFRQETHIQLCVREINCIKGYFRPLNVDGTLLQP
ncbi:hypothetical protein PAGU2196_36760 [Pseudomonas sp. PAGU 2196]|nr:hypothetical protein PAGU2196_36760 [Pseudomonas sp. PAGU 2196]